MTLTAPTTGVPSLFAPSRARLRAAGWTAVVGAVLYLAMPIVNSLGAAGAIDGATTENGLIDPSVVESYAVIGWLTSFSVAAFAVALLALVTMIDGMLRAGDVRHGAGFTTTAGSLAGGAWMLVAGLDRSMFGRAAGSLAETGADVGAQQAAYQSLNATGIGLMIAAGILTAVWLGGLAVSGRRVFGWGWRVVFWASAALLVGGMWVLAVPPANFVLVPVVIALGITLLLRARKAG